MNREQDVLHPAFEKILSSHLKAINENPGTSEANKKHIESFLVFCQSKWLTKARMAFYIQRLKPLAEFAGKKNFTELTRFDIDKFLAKCASGGSWSLDNYIVTLCCFYRHIFGLTSKDRVPDALRHLKRPRGKTSIKKKDLFTSEEIERILEATKSLEERIIVETLIETAARPSEFRSIKTSDVTIAADSITLHISGGKMAERGEERDVFILNPEYIQDFSLWFRNHPNRTSGGWLFYDKESTKPITYGRLSLMVKRAAEKANVNGRPIKLYLFRHSCLHELYKKYPTEAVRRMAGHSETSAMPSVYCHADSDDIKDMLIKGRGLEREVNPKELFETLLKMHEKHPEEFSDYLRRELNRLEGKI